MLRFTVGQEVKYRGKLGRIVEEWHDGQEWRYYVDIANERVSAPLHSLKSIYRRGENSIKSSSENKSSIEANQTPENALGAEE